jgi:hypothetical protein
MIDVSLDIADLASVRLENAQREQMFSSSLAEADTATDIR